MKYFNRNHIKETFKLALPVSIGQLGHIMMGVVDSIMVGHVGTVPLAAASIANGLFLLIMILGVGLSYAITSLVAIAVGEKKFEECGIILRQALITNVVFSVLLILVTFFASDLIYQFEQPEQVAVQANSYLKILAITILPFMLFQTYRQFSEGLSYVKPPMYIAVIHIFVNAFFNWIFIYGNLGAPKMELDGAGYATLITRTLMGVSMMSYIILNPKFKKFDPSLKFKKIDFAIIKKLIKVGLPSGFQYFFEVAAFAFSGIMCGWLGENQLAAHQIALNLASIPYMLTMGISSAGNIRVGNSYGMRNKERTRAAGFSAIILASFYMLISALLFIILNEVLPKIYISNQEVISMASVLLLIAALFQLFDGIQAVGTGILRGIVDVKIPMLLVLTSYWLIAIPAGYILAFKFDYGLFGVWYGFVIGLALTAAGLLLRFHLKSNSIFVSQ